MTDVGLGDGELLSQTPKQERNHIPDPPAGHNTAVPGPMPDLAPMIDSAVQSGMDYKDEGLTLISSPQGSGVDGHIIKPDGSMWDWSSGQQINSAESSSPPSQGDAQPPNDGGLSSPVSVSSPDQGQAGLGNV